MYNCRFQETVITVTPSSRYGQPYDIAHVESIFLMESPIPQTEVFLVPGIEKIPENILQILRLGKVDLAPIPKSEVISNISDFTQEIEQSQREVAVADAMLGIAAVYMKPIQLQPVGNNFYHLSYDYTLFPDANGNFYLYATLPFRGFQMPQGQVRFITVLPTGAQYDPNETKGVTLNNQIIDEQPVNVANGRQVISFFWQNDPDFTVKYRY